MKDEINSVQGKTVTIRVRGEIDNSAREAASFTGQGRNAYIGLSASNRAVGGPVTGGTPYIVGEVGPELFVPNTSGSIVPHNQLAGSTVVNFYYSPAISLTDRTEAETRLVPIIRKALARA
jgi:phage-related minor tail protein